ncbi:MAG: outer membrane beta-barrel domain-containing protein [Gammaproteobacteria bacterium]
MESRICSIFLTLVILISTLPTVLQAAEQNEEDQNSLIQPEIERTEFDESIIDSEDFELSAFAGILSIEDFGTNPVFGFELAYHVNEDVYVQFDYGFSEAGQTSFEVLSGGAPLLSDDERELQYYLFNIGFNLLPGEAFVTDSSTFNTSFYVIGGIGSTEFAGDDRFTINFGTGYQILFADAFSLNIDVRDLIFNMDVFGEDKVTHNLQYTVALGWFF